MKHKTSLITAVLALIAGVTMIVCNRDITGKAITMGGGILFIAAGLINTTLTLTLKDASGQRRTQGLSMVLAWVVNIASVAFGICVLAFEDTFVQLIPLIFGSLALLAALMLLYTLAIGIRPRILPAWLYILPLIMIVGGILIYRLHTPADDAMVMIYAGSTLSIFAVAVFFILGMLAYMRRSEAREALAGENDKKNVDHSAGQITTQSEENESQR